MILDHNINQGNEGIEWISNSDYSDSSLPESLGVSNNDDGTGRYGTDGNINKGPLTVLKKLKQKTGNVSGGANWKTRALGDYATYSAYLNDSLIYSIDYSSYAARLITSEEFYYISGESFNNTDYWISAPWLTIGLTSSYVLGVKGYWTSSFDSSNSSRAWRIYSDGEVRTYPVYHEMFGVRPVITVPVNVIYSN